MDQFNPGVPLSHYIDDHPSWDVELTCLACMARQRISMATTIARLKARGIEPRSFGIRAIATLIERRCSCGAFRWETRPGVDYPGPEGYGPKAIEQKKAPGRDRGQSA